MINKTSRSSLILYVISALIFSLFLPTACKKEKSVFAVADFSFSGNVSATLPVTVQFTNSSIGLSYTWDFGDGSSSVEENPRHTYTQNGIYRVKLLAKGTNNVDSLIVDVAIGGTLGQITALNCASAQVNRTIKTGDVLNQHPVLVPYTGGNGGIYNGQTISSTGVTGLTATLIAGSFVSGSGNLEYKLSGTPQSFGQAKFSMNVGGRSCELSILVLDPYRLGTVHCNSDSITVVTEIQNPITGKIWMDRNLGAARVAISPNDALSFGDVYQWGRYADGHQCRNNSQHTFTRSSSDRPNHSAFIIYDLFPADWRFPQNANLWQGESGVNNPCPIEFRLPTIAEWNGERDSWTTPNANGAFNSALKFTRAGMKNIGNNFQDVSEIGLYWTSSTFQTDSRSFVLTTTGAADGLHQRGNALSIRCIKD
jgi:PKD repeat protein